MLTVVIKNVITIFTLAEKKIPSKKEIKRLICFTLIESSVK